MFGIGSTVLSASDSAARRTPDIAASTIAVAATVTRPKDVKQNTTDKPVALYSIPKSPNCMWLIFTLLANYRVYIRPN